MKKESTSCINNEVCKCYPSTKENTVLEDICSLIDYMKIEACNCWYKFIITYIFIYPSSELLLILSFAPLFFRCLKNGIFC